MIGNANHYFNKKVVQKLKDESEITVDFFSLTSPDSKDLPYDHVFDASLKKKKTPFFLNLKGLKGILNNRYFALQLSSYLKNNPYDYIHFQSAVSWVPANVLLEYKDRMIVTIWGSDFYRARKWYIYKMKALFHAARYITMASNKVSADVTKVYHSSDKHRIVRFGLDVFDQIDKFRNKISKSTDKISITIGYNRHYAQQHLSILDALKGIKEDHIPLIKIILPFTYGPLDLNYKAELEERLNKLRVEYEFLMNYMSEEEVAVQCLKSDVMIQTQTTDAFSGSMQEYMYAENIVVTGDWLPYDDFKEAGVHYFTINKFKDLPDLMNTILNDFSKFKSALKGNAALLEELSSWKKNVKKWTQLYE